MPGSVDGQSSAGDSTNNTGTSTMHPSTASASGFSLRPTESGVAGMLKKKKTRMRIFLNDNKKNLPFEYPDNSIQTSKYTLLTFLPLFLQHQYKKASNIFLLAVCIITFIPGVSALGPAASLFPVIFVLLVAGLKEGYEDYKRHQADGKANSIKVRVLRNSEWVKISSCDVLAGDICLYEHGDEIRADSIVLASSNDDNVAFIETANLDGETTLKIRRAPQFCSKYLGNENDIMNACAASGVVILAGNPDPGLQRFKAAIHIGGIECQITSPEEEDEYIQNSMKSANEFQQIISQRNNNNNNNNNQLLRQDSGNNLNNTIPPDHSNNNHNMMMMMMMNHEHSMDIGLEFTQATTNTNTAMNNTTVAPSDAHAVGTAKHDDGDDASAVAGPPPSAPSPVQTHVSMMNNINNNNNDDNNASHKKEQKISSNPVFRSGLEIKHFVYRGSMLKNTEWALCATVYTGINTKLFLNLQQSPPRMSHLDVAVNEMIFALLVMHQVVIFILSGFAVDWTTNHSDLWYFQSKTVSTGDLGSVFGLRYLGYFVLLSFILPASLFVTIEVAKAVQAVFMSWDHGMATFDVASGQWLFCRPKTSSLNEQLGLVRYIFTDKTGTLTQNQMNVVRICYQDCELEDADGSVGRVVASKAEQLLLSSNSPPHHHSPTMMNTKPILSQPLLNKIDESSVQQLDDAFQDAASKSPKQQQLLSKQASFEGSSSSSAAAAAAAGSSYYRNYLYALRNDKLHLLLLNMALCHSVVCFDNPKHPLLKSYEGPSQDELALTSSARRNGYALMNRTSQGMELTLPGQIHVVFDLLSEMEFSSERQMMSVLVRDGTLSSTTNNNNNSKSSSAATATTSEPTAETVVVEDANTNQERFILFSKGADSAMFHRAAHHEENRRAIKDIMNQLEGLCSLGLRTLVFGYRVLSKKEKNHWLKKWESAKCAMENRVEKMAEVAAEIERDLDILGVVGIEDRLQDAVPETLHFLKQTGITVWMLTGDKRETAVAIAETSKLLTPETDFIAHIDVTEIAEDDFTPVEAVRAACLEQIAIIQNEWRKPENKDKPLVLVADGVSLKVALESEDVFMDLAIHAKSAVCCRLSPLLKAQLVRLFQTRTNETVLAIGDGANDVSMIQESMVGIGIMGLEGSQAELSASYAIPQFKNLKRLLVVHGRYAWYRTTTCMIYTIFKNAALTFCLVFYSIWSAYSGATLFDSWLLTMFNTFFTQATPLIIGGIDTDIDDDIVMECPELYGYIRRNSEYFNARVFTMWFLDAAMTSAVVFFLVLAQMTSDNLGKHTGVSLEHYGTNAFLVLLLLVDAYALVTQQLYSSATGLIVFVNWSLIPIIMFLYSFIPIDSSFNFTKIPEEVFSDRLLYLFSWIANSAVVFVCRIGFGRLFNRLWPSECQLMMRKRVLEKQEREEREKKSKIEKEEKEDEEVSAIGDEEVKVK